jgi:hypothetical protein
MHHGIPAMNQCCLRRRNDRQALVQQTYPIVSAAGGLRTKEMFSIIFG